MKKVVSAFLLAVLFPFAALACGEETTNGQPGVLGKLYGAIDTTALSGKQRIFLRFDSTLDQINYLIENRLSVRNHSANKAHVYDSLEAAATNLNPNDKYILEINLKDGLYRGHVVRVYNRKQQALQGYAIFKCIGSPLYFEDKVVLMI